MHGFVVVASQSKGEVSEADIDNIERYLTFLRRLRSNLSYIDKDNLSHINKDIEFDKVLDFVEIYRSILKNSRTDLVKKVLEARWNYAKQKVLP